MVAIFQLFYITSPIQSMTSHTPSALYRDSGRVFVEVSRYRKSEFRGQVIPFVVLGSLTSSDGATSFNAHGPSFSVQGDAQGLYYSTDNTSAPYLGDTLTFHDFFLFG